MNTALLIDGPYAGRTVNVGERMTHILLPADPAIDEFIDQVHAHQLDPANNVRYDFTAWGLLTGKLIVGALSTGDGVPFCQLADMVLSEAARKAWTP